MEKNSWNVLVNGMGNIGTSIANLLLKYRTELNLDKIYVVKRSVFPWNEIERKFLIDNGAIICSLAASEDITSLSEIMHQIDYVFEATANGVGVNNLDKYKLLEKLKGASAQGSEKGFGIPFMSGVNDELLANEKFVNIVSCNTHGSAALLKTFAGKNLGNLEHADFVVVRRSEDIGNHERLVAANVVARHLNAVAGTHHAIDVIDMFATKNIVCNLTSSDITTPSQLMHAVRFNIELKKPLSASIENKIKENPFVSTTKKFDSNVVFELGRRYGFNGRIYSHAIIVSENLLVTDTSVKGWAFVPQEGNSLLSTLHAFILQMRLDNGNALLEIIKSDLLKKEW